MHRAVRWIRSITAPGAAALRGRIVRRPICRSSSAAHALRLGALLGVAVNNAARAGCLRAQLFAAARPLDALRKASSQQQVVYSL